MITRRRFLVLMGIGLPVAAGAGTTAWAVSSDDDQRDTPRMQWGQEECTHCRMIIDDRRFAAAWIARNGDEQHFDDIGCMVAAIRADGGKAEDTRYFVQDFDADAWLDARVAIYMPLDDVRSPMNYNMAAFTPAAAARHAHHGHWTWHRLVAQLKKDE